jgi:NAD(P)-dependent dehydrogenase (short-subunit alcohol dehydrogenase family)
MQLNDKVSAIVTGGASGLGAATARALARHMNDEKGEAVATDIGGCYCKVNITSEEEVKAAFDKARAVNGQERILINCAGVGTTSKVASRDRKTGEIRRFPMDQFERVVGVNLVGNFRCITHAAAGMLTLDPLPDGDRGVIINTASIAAYEGQPGQAAYTASKAGIVGITLVVARDLCSEQIRCNTIVPGIMDTPLMAGAPAALRETLSASVPYPRRFGTADEYAHLALTMITNNYLNGECVRLDGALRMGLR